MAEEYDLATVRNLLNDAFNAGEISTLAFDLFQPVYGDFAAGMNKGQMIKAIVEHANKHGRIPDLLSYVKNANRYQYENYADRLQPVPRATSQEEVAIFAYQEQRLRTLKQHIQDDLELLYQYEEQYRLEDDPRRLKKIRHEIERQQESLAGYQREAATLGIQLEQHNIVTDSSIQALLDIINDKLDNLSRQVVGVKTHVTAGQQAVLAHIDQRHQETVATILNQLDANQLEVVELLLDAADQQQVAQWEGQQLTLLAQQALVELRRVRASQPDAAEWQSLLALLERDTSLEQKLKLTIPIIPGLLEYENELSVDVKEMLKQAWSRLSSKVKGKR